MAKQYIKMLSRGGYRVYLTPKDFVDAACEYFEWCVDTPLEEEKIHFTRDGDVVRAHVPHMRPFTFQGLASYVGVSVSRMRGFAKKDDDAWQEAYELVEQVIYTQKFEGAAAGLLNSSIIIRDLGLSDKTEQEVTHGGPVTLNITTVPKGTSI